ncbi:hypothetical protein FACS1894142_3570 [Spirochaetia bacterium]|nr:hypothetical protein FACS1894142_3570 [Spirochaetia bacterium]
MAKDRKKYWLLLVLMLFTAYFFIASRPVPVETILVPRWLNSLESGYPIYLNGTADSGADSTSTGDILPFELGNRFGYVDTEGRFIINQIKKGSVALSAERWIEYPEMPDELELRHPLDDSVVRIEAIRGYPLFLDSAMFLINDEQNSISKLDDAGAVRWTYDFAAPLTDIDAAAGLLLAGSLDGTVELLDDEGTRIFFFAPGGSRYSVILGCRISEDGSRLAIVSGIDDQRFLLLERFGDAGVSDYKVAYHEFLGDGFRRAVHLAFIDNDRRIAFEREGGLGIYEIISRKSLKLSLEGTINALDGSGDDGLLFIITSQSGIQKELVAVRMPGTIIIEAPFRSENSFLGRQGPLLYIGGGTTIGSFKLDRR